MATIPSNLRFPTSAQNPSEAIMDLFGKQVYLGNTFVYASSVSVSGTSEQPFYTLANPLDNAKSLFVNLRKVISGSASLSVIMKCYIAPIVSVAGNAQTAINMRPANGNLATGVLQLSPTVSANGSLILVEASNAFDPKFSQNLVILDPGQVMLVTFQCSASDTVLFELGWYEL